jgi:hypothetical protein
MPTTERVNLSATTETTPKRLIEPAGIFAVAAGVFNREAMSRNSADRVRKSKRGVRIVTLAFFRKFVANGSVVGNLAQANGCDKSETVDYFWSLNFLIPKAALITSQ